MNINRFESRIQGFVIHEIKTGWNSHTTYSTFTIETRTRDFVLYKLKKNHIKLTTVSKLETNHAFAFMKRYFGKWLGCNFAIAVIFVSLQIFKVYHTLKDTERFCKMYTFICKANTLRCKIYTLKCKKYALKCKIYTLICAMYTLICKNPRNPPPPPSGSANVVAHPRGWGANRR